jgi:hypothetical protein
VRTIELDGEPALLVPYRRATLLLAVALELVIAALGVLALAHAGSVGEAVFLLVLFVVPFGGLAVVTLAGLGRPRGLALTPTHVIQLGPGGRVDIAWENVAWVDVFDLWLTPKRIAVEARDRRAVRRAGVGRLGRGRLAILVPAVQLRLPAADVVALLDRWRTDPGARRTLVIGEPA